MVTNFPVTIELPPDIYEQIQQIAETNDSSVEKFLLEAVLQRISAPSMDIESQLSILETFSDALLWAVVEQRLTPDEEARMDELTELKRQGTLSPQENTELNAIIDKIQRQMLLRSDALLRLKQRGHHIDAYFKHKSA